MHHRSKFHQSSALWAFLHVCINSVPCLFGICSINYGAKCIIFINLSEIAPAKCSHITQFGCQCYFFFISTTGAKCQNSAFHIASK